LRRSGKLSAWPCPYQGKASRRKRYFSVVAGFHEFGPYRKTCLLHWAGWDLFFDTGERQRSAQQTNCEDRVAAGFDGSASRGLPDVVGALPPPPALSRLTEFGERFGDAFAEFLEKAAPTLSFWFWSIEQVPDSPPINEYEACFIESGYTLFEARLLAFLLIELGETLRQESLAEAKLSSAVNSVVKAEGATTLVISRRAEVLRRALSEPVAGMPLGIACSLAGVGKSFPSFWELVERAASGDGGACRELVRTSKALTAHLVDSGRLRGTRYKKVFLHLVEGGPALDRYGPDTKMEADFDFFLELFDIGYKAGRNFLEENFESIGVRGTLELKEQLV
jgi:hypothetical protein